MQDFEEQERRLMAALGRLGAAMERLNEAPPAAEVEAASIIDSAAEVEIARLSQLLEAARAEAAAQAAQFAAERAAQEAQSLAERSALEVQLAAVIAAQAEQSAANRDAAAAQEKSAQEQVAQDNTAQELGTQELALAVAEREAQAAAVIALQEQTRSLQAELEGKIGEIHRLRQVNLQIREALFALRQALSAGVADPSAINQSLAAEVEALRASRSSESAEIDALLRSIEPLVAQGTAAAAASKEADNA